MIDPYCVNCGAIGPDVEFMPIANIYLCALCRGDDNRFDPDPSWLEAVANHETDEGEFDESVW